MTTARHGKSWRALLAPVLWLVLVVQSTMALALAPGPCARHGGAAVAGVAAVVDARAHQAIHDGHTPCPHHGASTGTADAGGSLVVDDGDAGLCPHCVACGLAVAPPMSASSEPISLPRETTVVARVDWPASAELTRDKRPPKA